MDRVEKAALLRQLMCLAGGWRSSDCSFNLRSFRTPLGGRVGPVNSASSMAAIAWKQGPAGGRRANLETPQGRRRWRHDVILTPLDLQRAKRWRRVGETIGKTCGIGCQGTALGLWGEGRKQPCVDLISWALSLSRTGCRCARRKDQ